MASSSDLTSSIADLAAGHGLSLEESSITVNEMGLDFRVTLARTTSRDACVLRIPRRTDVMERAETEGRLLSLVAPRLRCGFPIGRSRRRI